MASLADLHVEVRVQFRSWQRLTWRERFASLRPWRSWGWVAVDEDRLAAMFERMHRVAASSFHAVAGTIGEQPESREGRGR